MSSLLTPGERPGIWDRVGDLAKRVGRLEAVPPGGSTGGRTIWGAIYNDAVILNVGSNDWTAALDVGTGVYTITFDTPLSGDPVILLTPNMQNPPMAGNAYFVQDFARSPSDFNVQVYDQTFSIADGGFDFLCIEPA